MQQQATAQEAKPSTDLEFEFEEIATSVEERFRRAYNAEMMGTAKTEGQVEYEEVSLGWWLVIRRLGLALWIGKEKPGIESGDLLRISIRKHDLAGRGPDLNGRGPAHQ